MFPEASSHLGRGWGGGIVPASLGSQSSQGGRPQATAVRRPHIALWDAGNVALERKRNSSHFADQTQLVLARGSYVWQELANST